MTKKIVTSSAPGKVILHGEYAVVFSKHAIAVSVDLRTTVTIEVPEVPSSSLNLVVNLLNFNCSRSWKLTELDSLDFVVSAKPDDPPSIPTDVLSSLVKNPENASVEQALKAFLYLYLGICRQFSVPFPSLTVTVSSDFPAGAGLGSSAAYSTSLAGGLFKALTGKEASLETVSRWAFVCEHIFHGKPSGIDNSICTFGGAVFFKDGQVLQNMKEFARIPALLVYTNVMRNTKTLVESVSRKREKFPGVVARTMDAIDEISTGAWKLISEGKYKEDDLRQLVTMNQHLLNALGAGHDSIDNVLNIGKKYNLVGKLTGAGGGGCVIIHLPTEISADDTAKITRELEANGYKSWSLSFGGPGLQISS